MRRWCAGDWSRNYDRKFDGPMTVREALARSKNMVTIQVLELIGVERARAWPRNFGFEIERQPSNLTLALGSGRPRPCRWLAPTAPSPTAATAWAPLLVSKITDAKGAVLFEGPAG